MAFSTTSLRTVLRRRNMLPGTVEQIVALSIKTGDHTSRVVDPANLREALERFGLGKEVDEITAAAMEPALAETYLEGANVASAEGHPNS